jgi:hypothetical protein
MNDRDYDNWKLASPYENELYDNIDGFIKFETNYNSEIGDF